MTNGSRWVALCAIWMVGCGCDEGPTARPDAGDPVDAIVLPDVPVVPDATRADTMPPFDGCDVGDACTADRGCRASAMCLVTGFPDGYCSQLAPIGMGGCDPEVEGSCGECGECVFAGSSGGLEYTLCASRCTPSLTDNACRDGYECTLGGRVCLPGCASDADCGDPAVDPAGTWTCNLDTHRCEHVPPDGAEAGIACTRDTECELRGRCLDEATTEWPEGYCIKLGCDVAGNECAGGGYCDERAFGLAVCLAPCEVGAAATVGDPFAASRDCRAAYACFWDGVSGPGEANGGCIPGTFNDVRVANVGATCDAAAGDAAGCWSPFGLGQCRDWDGAGGPGGGYCTVFDCAAPGIDDTTVCGDGGVCASVSGSVTTLCLEACATAEDCTAGYGCWDTGMAGITTGGEPVCFTGCLEDAHCRAGETCVGATMTMLGTCQAS